MKKQEWKDPSGLLHRKNGPAVINGNGDKFYYEHGLLHRLNGPAIMLTNGTKIYMRRHLIHRDNGPAVIKPNGKKEFWINNFQLKNIKSTAELIIYLLNKY